MEITKEQLEKAIANAEHSISFEDMNYDKQYYRGVKDALKSILDIIDEKETIDIMFIKKCLVD